MGSKDMVIPIGNIVHCEIGYHHHAYDKLQPCRYHAGRIEPLHAKKSDAHRMDKTLYETEGCHGDDNQRCRVENKRYDA